MAHTRTPTRSCLRHPIMDLNRFPSTTHGHEFHNGLSRVVMVRKTELTMRSSKTGEEPKIETVTRETVETFSGSGTRTQRVTTSEKRDVKKLPPELLTKFNGVTIEPEVKIKPVSAKSRSPSTSPDRKQKTEVKTISKTRTKSDSDISGGEGDFPSDCLRAHNEYRQKHGVPPLKLNKKICKYSEEWAKHLASRGHMEHRQNSDYGENIFCSWSSNPNHRITGREPVDNWYSEIKSHPFGREPKDLKSGHFSQVVWRDSRELGVAVAKSRTGQIFVVCNYSPPGNFIGSFAENVPPLGGFPGSQAQNGSRAVSPMKHRDDTIDDEEFAQEGVRIHNEYRRKHGVPDLKLNKQLCNYAKEWAKAMAKENSFGHRPDGKYGENIYCMWSSDSQHTVTAKDACQSWYKEIKDHQFGAEPRQLKSGHFTQMIWKGSKELGMGIARSKNGRVLIVANYNPRGNYLGQFTENVPRPL
ncbi:uncharacterized protein [Anabrus simplex]|uniref:uncharacterized protein isoform X2 n=1 Tax=Anabrus simplex TaxID=316456 RepID=UPI0035A2E882